MGSFCKLGSLCSLGSDMCALLAVGRCGLGLIYVRWALALLLELLAY